MSGNTKRNSQGDETIQKTYSRFVIFDFAFRSVVNITLCGDEDFGLVSSKTLYVSQPKLQPLKREPIGNVESNNDAISQTIVAGSD
jgi:hypothetical protein